MSGAVCAIINGPCNGSSGPPVASTVIKIVGIDGSLQPQYHEGEICVKGPQVFILLCIYSTVFHLKYMSTYHIICGR